LNLQSAGQINFCESLGIVHFWWLVEITHPPLQGVLLLNTALTVREGEPLSHRHVSPLLLPEAHDTEHLKMFVNGGLVSTETFLKRFNPCTTSFLLGETGGAAAEHRADLISQ